MRIEVDKIAENGGAFAHAYEPAEIVLDEEHLRLTEPPQIQGRVKLRRDQVDLHATLTARAVIDCDRCLNSVALPVETEFDVTYIPAADYAAQETAELNAEDLTLSVFDGEAIDIDELVREQILLALPTRALCREDCLGLCPVCGADKNLKTCGCETEEIDPRWAALKNLKNRQS